MKIVKCITHCEPEQCLGFSHITIANKLQILRTIFSNNITNILMRKLVNVDNQIIW